jgi:hypothetical protein
MKPFDFELAKAGATVTNVAGDIVRVICFDRKSENDDYPIVALVLRPDKLTEDEEQFTREGEYWSDGGDSKHNLQMASVKKSGWINVYSPQNAYVGGFIFESKSDALAGKITGAYIDTIEIHWEE